MIKRAPLFALLIIGNVINCSAVFAQGKDVDQADTLDFESFHKDKKEAIKVWDKNSTSTTKAYQDQPAANTSTGTAPAAATGAAAAATTETTQAKSTTAAVADNTNKRFEIRERYTLTRSAKTPYSAFYVIEPLYKQSAQLCPKGWKKLTEKSEPIEQDYYLYYEIECL